METSTQARLNEDIRRRNVETVASTSSLVEENVDQNGQTNTEPRIPGSRRREHRTFQSMRASVAFMIICIFYIIIFLFVHSRLNSYPEAKLKTSSEDFEFLEENARAHLELITGLGPRVSGSEANNEAEHYILHTIKRIRAESLTNHKIDVDVQKASGGFTLDFVNVGIGEFTSVYQNLTNIVVKLSPPSGAKDSVMINCHYDTVIDSPGKQCPIYTYMFEFTEGHFRARLVGWLVGFLTASSTTRLYRGRAPRQERLTILHAATHETELGDHGFCFSRSHYTDTDPTSRERAATAGSNPGPPLQELRALPRPPPGQGVNKYKCVAS